MSGQSLEKANNELIKAMVDAMNNRLSPSRSYDRGTMSKALAETINTRIPNQVVGLDYSLAGEQMKPLLDPSFYDVPAIIAEVMQANELRINNQMGVNDAQALARLRQMPSADSTERIMDALGPIVKDQSRNMESSICDQGNMWMYLAFQFYRSPRIFEVLGPTGLVDETVQFKYGDLVPAAVPGVDADASEIERARKHAGNFTFSLTPYSLHELNSISRKLFHLQLSRSGFPVDWWTLADIFDIRNFGKKPLMKDPETGEMRECLTVIELWMAQQEIMLRFQAAAAGAVQQAAAEHGPPGASPGPSRPPGPHPGGRPPSGQNPPSMEMKSDGRPIIRESKR